jgi:endonuclease/exonuclease/phosphatase family metal-dependent hydrolase
MHRALPFLAVATVVLAAGCTSTSKHQAPRPQAGQHVAVMTYNLNYGLSGDLAGVRAIADADVDVVLLQEVTPAWERTLRNRLADAFPHQRHHAHAHAGGVSILSRYPIVADELLPQVSWFPAQRNEIDTPLGRVQTLNVHLRPPFSDSGSVVSGYFVTPKVRDEEIELFLVALRDDLPTVIAGDFNEPDGPASARLRARGFGNALGTFAPGAPTWRWPVPVLGEVENTLDHIWVDGDLVAVDAWVEDRGRSDHKPVVALLQRAARGG